MPSNDDKIISFPGAKPRPVAANPALGAPYTGENHQAGDPYAELAKAAPLTGQRAESIPFDRAREPSDDETGYFIKDAQGNVIKLTNDQQKAMQCIVSNMAFVFIGIHPTPTGADFYRATNGDDATLRNAYDAIHSQVDKAYAKRNLL